MLRALRGVSSLIQESDIFFQYNLSSSSEITHGTTRRNSTRGTVGNMLLLCCCCFVLADDVLYLLLIINVLVILDVS